MSARCVDCKFLDLRGNKVFAKLGMGKCRAQNLAPATFITACFARECPRFQPAELEAVAKRLIFLGEVA